MIRSVARSVRYAPDRVMHSARHAAARAALAEYSGGLILFVCHGNICRSPYAEHALIREHSSYDRLGWQVESSGFVKPDRPSPPAARTVAARRGVDLDAHRSRLLTQSVVAVAELIYVMSAAQQREIQAKFGADRERVWVLGDLDPEPVVKRTIKDPIDQPEAVFEAVYDRIDRCIAVIGAATVRPGS